MSRSPKAPDRASGREDAAREAWAIIMQFMKVAKQRSLSEFDLTPSQAQLLYFVSPEKPMPMSELAGRLGCDASNVTGLVDRLEERGFLERRADAEDRRVKMIAVTTSGAKQIAKIHDLWVQAPAAIQGLPEKDKRELLRILRKAAEAEG